MGLPKEWQRFYKITCKGHNHVMVLRIFSIIYGIVVGIRNSLFDFGILRARHLPKKVISVGNVTAGGTGKTPLVMKIAEIAERENLKMAILSRGYRRSSRGIQKVDLNHNDGARYYGDEPWMMAKRWPKVSVYVGSCRYDAGQLALKQESIDFFVLDDGFQHRYLHRDLNILVFDASADKKDLSILPAGRARENVTAAVARANLIVLSRVQQAQSHQLEWLRAQLPSSPERVFEMNNQVSSIEDGQGQQIEKTSLVHKKVIVLCGVARPQGFKKMIANEFNCQILGEVFKKDHYHFTPDDFAHAEQMRERVGAEYVLLTEKDGVKLGWQKWPQFLQIKITADVQPKALWERAILQAVRGEG